MQTSKRLKTKSSSQKEPILPLNSTEGFELLPNLSIPEQNNAKSQTEEAKPFAHNYLSHHPIVFDADIEKFKARLDNMLNTFKLESISEILTAKRNLLKEQADFISDERKKHEIIVGNLNEQVF